MNKKLTELVFILDRSGSMSGLEGDTVGGFNSLIREQKEKEGKALVSLVLFNQQSEVLLDRKDLQEVKELEAKAYRVGGCTALIDALGGAIHHIGMVHRYIRKEDVPGKVLFVIMTDGLENASHQYSSDKVKKMIEEKKELGWEFLFLGANIDAVETAAEYGIDAGRAVRYHSDAVGTATNFGALKKAISDFRVTGAVDEDWCASIAEDYEERK
ncbi:MAG: VWA domain-containing protein [Erysipelotrichaceae bacterium]|nr:VWA domain-containing protein [Erysipelotrichaceae bacterium]